MLNNTLLNIFNEIEKGITISGHPFKFGCLSSILNNSPEQRMVVIRKLIHNELTIYTDKRSPKVDQFISNPKASILFYDTSKMTQIILKGSITINEDKNLDIWKHIPEFAHKDYTTSLAPGTPITTSKSDYKPEVPNFCYLQFNFNYIEYLSIGNPYNTRAQFKLIDAEWEGSYMVP